MIVWKTSEQNVVTSGDCGSAGVSDRYELIAGREMDAMVVVQWPGNGQSLAYGDPKWKWHYGIKTSKIVGEIPRKREAKLRLMWTAQILSHGAIWSSGLLQA